MRTLLVLLIAALALLAPRPARAHGMRSAYLEVNEVGDVGVVMRLASSVPASGLSVPPPEGCRAESVPGDAAAAPLTMACEGGLEGHVVRVSGIGAVVSEIVVAVTFADGRTVSHILTASEPAWAVPRTSRRAGLLSDYARLGVLHIFGGADHLLFLLALALSVRKLRAVVLAESAFTASHTLTFTASALGWIHVAPAAAEACIAASLVLVALDAAEATQGGRLVPARRAAGLAFAFGLVHGLGFAGGLAEIGLPDRAIGWALGGFAIGVELGQIAFLALILASLQLIARAPSLRRAPLALSYAVGSTGAFLLFERMGRL
jgi:hydrogenase/urease accessory protein HupE